MANMSTSCPTLCWSYLNCPTPSLCFDWTLRERNLHLSVRAHTLLHQYYAPTMAHPLCGYTLVLWKELLISIFLLPSPQWCCVLFCCSCRDFAVAWWEEKLCLFPINWFPISLVFPVWEYFYFVPCPTATANHCVALWAPYSTNDGVSLM